MSTITLLLLFSIGGVGAKLAFSQSKNIDDSLSATETLNVYPASAKSVSWSGAQEVLTPDLPEDAVYQKFSARNSAFVSKHTIQENQIQTQTSSQQPSSSNPDSEQSASTTVDTNSDIPSENETIQTETTETTESAAPVTEDETTPLEVLESTPSAVEETTPADTASEPVSLKKATPAFFTFFESITRFLPFTNTATVLDSQTEEEENGVAAEVQAVVQTEEVPVPLVEEVPLAPEAVSEPVSDEATTTVQSSSEEVVLPELDADTTVHTISLSDFSIPELKQGEFMNGMQLRLSLGAQHKVDESKPMPILQVVYKTPSSTQEVGTIEIDEEVSNAINGGYFLFALPEVVETEKLKDITIEITYKGDKEDLESLYLDAVWLEVDIEKIDKDLLEAKVLQDTSERLEDPKLSTLLTPDVDFTRGELPKFSLRYNSQRNVAIAFFRDLFGRPLASVEKVSMVHNDIGDIGASPKISMTSDGLLSIAFLKKDEERLQPGEYTVELEINEGGKIFTDSFAFQWGLLAINSHKTSYEVGQTVELSMGSLSPNGNTVCDANLQLYIINPENAVSKVTVNPSGVCNGNNVVDVPDYTSTFVPETVGEYEMYLERQADDGSILSHTSDMFLVVAELPLSLERKGPSRIYPKEAYPMEITVHAKSSWDGKLVEVVPADFTISSTTATILRVGDTQELTWDVTVDASSTQSVSYTFDAPDISPYLYTAGKARLEGELAVDVTPAEVVPTSDAPQDAESTIEPLEQPEINNGSETLEETAAPEPAVEEIIEPIQEESPTLLEKIIDILPFIGDDTPEVENIPSAEEPQEPVDAEDEPVVELQEPTAMDQVVAEQLEQRIGSTTIRTQSGVAFEEHRQWQIASDATGSMIVYWARTTAVPAGWTCLSCGSGTFFQKFPKGGPTYNTTGGAATHGHSASGTVGAASAAANSENRAGSLVSLPSHSHTITPAVTSTSSLPAYRQYRVIQNNSAGEPATVPAGVVLMFDSAVPTGWTRYSALDARYVRGENSIANGGSNTHRHTVSGTTAAASGSTVDGRAGGTQVNASDVNHTHTISTSTPLVNNEPPFISVIYGTSTAATSTPTGAITMWTDTPPAQWQNQSATTTDPFYDKFTKGSATYGTTGGADTHTHANITGIVSSGGTIKTARTGATGSNNTHTHLVDVSNFTTGSNVPPFVTAIFGRKYGAVPLYTQTKYRWFVNADVSTPTDAWPVGAAELLENEDIDTSNVPVKYGDVVRLRMQLGVSNSTSTADTFKLQFASTTATCAAAGTWTDVGAATSSALWRGYNNASVADGATLSSSTLSGTDDFETYEEANPTASTPNTISTSQEGEWDFVLQQNGAYPGATYCFRMVKSAGTVLYSYTAYPMLVTNLSPDSPTLTKLFNNEKTSTTTPDFEFSGSDAEANDLTYQIQVDDDYTFGSTNIDKNSVTNSTQFSNLATPADKDPFTQGERIFFNNTTALTNGTTYYWRVRAKDPTGSNAYGSWSTIYSFTVDTSVTLSTWFQTRTEQFDTNTLTGVQGSSNQAQLRVGSTTGTMYSDPITFSEGQVGTAWGSFAFTDTEVTSDLKYTIQYNDDDVWTDIPDSVLAGNVAGFDTSPVSLLGVDKTIYTELRIEANFVNSGASPSVQDWTVTWGYLIETPTITAPFANEKVATTTPTFEFTTTDPQSDSLQYQIQWSTTYAFTASTTRNSNVNAGFSNITTPADTDPFNSGNTIQFKIQAADALTNGTTYWWRVKARDPGGSNTYSFFTTPRSFTVDTAVTVSTWFQTTQSQFSTDVLSNGYSRATNVVTVATTTQNSLIAYAEGTVTTPRYRTWNGTVWTAESNALDVGAAINWAVTKASPNESEYVLATMGTDSDVNVQVFSNGSWGDLQEVTATAPNAAMRGFDVAYETSSGDAMVVTCDGDADPTYYIWDGSTWTNNGAIGLTGGNTCGWIKLISDPVSDEIIAVTRDTSGITYEARVWTGSAWGNSATWGSMNQANHEGIAAEYEESGGQAVVAVSNGTAASFSWRAWNGTTWSAAAAVTLGDDFEAGSIVQDKGSDNMALCYVDEDGDIGAVRWTGAAWAGQTELETAWTTANNVYNDRPIDCAFEVGGARDGYIMAVYSDTTNLRYRSWNGATWAVEASVSTVQDGRRVQVRRTGNNLIQAVINDTTNDRYDYSYWNGTAWSAFQTLEADASVGATPYKEPFMIAAGNPSSLGTVTGDPLISFYEGSGPYWKQMSWTDTTTGGSDILYQLEYFDGTSWALVPNSLLPGNSAGTTTSPINLSNILPVSTYSQIRPVANMSCNLGTCPSLSDWTVTWSAGITISGTAKQYDQSTNVTSGTVAVAVNGVLQVGKTGTISGGTWSIANVNAAADDVLTIFITGATDATEAVAVAKYDGVGDIAGVNLFERHISIGSDDLTTLTNANLALYDFTNTEDIFFDVDAGNDFNSCATTGCNAAELIIKAGNTYQSGSGGDVTTKYFENNGTLKLNGNTMRVTRSWDNNATTSMATSTVIFTATSTAESIDGTGAISPSFNNLTFGSSTSTATWTTVTGLDVNGNLTVSGGTLARGSTAMTLAGNLSNALNGTWTGMGTTTFDGTAVATWSDASAAVQNIGRVVVDGTNKSVILGSNVKARSVKIGADDTLDASVSGYNLTVYTNWNNLNVFTARTGTVLFAATTTGRTITTGSSNFYNLSFTGSGGGWSFTGSTLGVDNDFGITAGTVTMPTATTTIAGSFTNAGTFVHNNSLINFTTSGSKTLTLAGTALTNAFYNVLFSGSGSWSFTEANATTSNLFRITQGNVTMPSNTLSIGDTFTNSAGTFTHNSGTIKFTNTGTKVIDTNSSFYSLRFTGAGSAFSFLDSSVTLLGNLTTSAGTLTLPSGTLSIGGSLTNSATLTHNNGTVLFNSGDTGEFVNTGNSSLYNMTFNSGTGGWTVSESATTTNNTTITAVNSFTLTSGKRLSVGATFTNSVGGAATTWTGSTLVLQAGNYSLNAKANTGDVYNILQVKASTNILMWNSSASTYTVDATGSLYSQDHGGVDGDLYVFGNYQRTSGTEHWSYATDFDGAALGGGGRQVDVRFASGASANFTTATLEIIGTSGNETIIDRQSTGLYGVALYTSTINAEYYSFAHLNTNGLVLDDATTITSLENGHFTLDAVGGTSLTISTTTIDANPALQILDVTFDTSLGTSSNMTTGNGDNTFLFFDDFADGSINASKWTKDVELGAISETGGYLRAGGGITSGNYGFTSLGSEVGFSSFLNNAVVWRGRNSTDGIGELAFRGDYGTNQGYKARFDARVGANGNAFLEPPYVTWNFSNGTGTCTSDSDEPTANTWYTYQITASTTNYKMYRDGTLKRDCTDASFTAAGEIALQNHYGSYTDYDWVGVRKFVNAEPTHGAWAAEEQPFPGIYREGHTITGTASGAQTNYVLPITVNMGAGTDSGQSMYCSSLCNTDFSDVRFADASGAPLDYWREESYTASSSAVFWVEFPSIPASPSTVDVYVYYGNTEGYNVTVPGSVEAGSYVWFRNHSGNHDGESFDSDPGSGAGDIRWDDSPLPLTISGTVYSDDGVTPLVGGTCNGVATPVRVKVEGGATYDGTCSAVNGSYSIPGVVSVGDPTITVFLNGASGGQKAVTVTKTPTGDITGFDLYANRVITRHQDVSPMSIADMASYDSSDDADILFTAATGTSPILTTLPNTELFVWATTTFTPGGTVTLRSGGTGTTYDGSLHIKNGATFTGSGTTTYSIGGTFTKDAQSTFVPASTTVLMTATTTGKSIAIASGGTGTFNLLRFTGVGGGWNINGNISTASGLDVATGTVTGTGNIAVTNGSFSGNGTLSLGSGTTTISRTNTLGGTRAWTFANLVLGNGTNVGTTTPASTATTTISGKLTIANAHYLKANNAKFNLSGSGNVFLKTGTFLQGSSTVRYSGTTATNVISANYYNLDLAAAAGSPTYTGTGLGTVVSNNLRIGTGATTTVNFNTSDPSLDVNGAVTIAQRATFIGSNSAAFTVAGNWTNSGTFTSSSGTVTFDGGSTTSISAGNSPFGNVIISGTGSFTVASPATTTSAFTLTNATAFTVSSAQSLAVGGVFTNGVGGAATTWTGSTLRLFSPTNYQINAKTISDVYETISIASGTNIRMWNSSASTYTLGTTGSLYSQDHSSVDGSLYIYGNYPGNGGTDYWSYATDFDGTSLSPSERQVNVRFANGATALYTSGGLRVLGASSASTTIANQGSGTYGFRIGGTASTSWSYYDVKDTVSAGLTFSGTPNVVSLSRGSFTVSTAGGSAITVGGTAINANTARTFTNNIFATTSAIAAYNVTATGTAVSSWRFTNHTGNLAGELKDVDPDGDPGYIVWDNSAASVTISGRVYSDEGSTVSTMCDSTNPRVHLRIAGLTSYTTSCNGDGAGGGTGAYSIPGITFSPGDSLVVYIDGGSAKGAVVTEDLISSVANMDVYENRVIVRHENTDPLSIADMALWDSTDDADVPFTAVDAATDTLTLPANRKLLVWTGKTFTPAGNVTLSGGGGGASYDGTLEAQTNAVVTFTGTEQHSIGGSFIFGTGATFTAAQSTTTFTTTGAARTIDVNNQSFYNTAFTGSGSWTNTDNTFTLRSARITAGALTLPTGTTTVSGSWNTVGGSFVVNGSPMVFTATAGGNIVRANGSNFKKLIFNGVGGSWSMTDTNATATAAVTITKGTVSLPSGVFAVGGSFSNTGGTITHNTSELFMTSTTSATLLASTSSLFAVSFKGTGPFTFSDTSLTLADDLRILQGSVTLPTGTLSVGGSWTTTGGTFSNATGTVLFNASATGKTINTGSSNFYNVQFGSASGGWTFGSSATTTHNFSLTSALSFTAASSTRLFVGGVFTNSVGGSATVWTGSTLALTSGTEYSINTKTTGGDLYQKLTIGANTDISMWNSRATTTVVSALGSLYSQDHNAVDGSLNIYGDYHISTTTRYWSYATDFDGTTLGGSPRDVTVSIIANATTTVDGGALNIVGAPSHETMITNQGSGTYAFKVQSGSFNGQYYKYRNLNSTGLSFTGSPTVYSLSSGDFELAVAGGSLIRLASTTLNANASLVITGNRFATTTAITGTNVRLVGTTTNAWTFSGHTGNIDGESYDFDGGTLCGSIRWSDSSCLLTQQTHYRWRNDDGNIGVPNSEWLHASWTARQRVRLQNPDATTYTNAVVKVHVTYDSDMQTDFDDLRFTDASGTTTLKYFVERYTASADADVWVKVPSLAASDSTTLFMYYKNAVAPSTSSSTQTFLVADDFEDGNKTEYSGDTSLFTVDGTFAYGGSYGLDTTGNENSRATDGIGRTDVTVSQGQIIRFMQYVATGSGDEVCTLFGVQAPVTINDNYGICLEQVGGDRMSIVKDVIDTETSGTFLASTSVSFTAGWYEIEVDWQSGGQMDVTLTKNGTFVASTTATNNTYTSGGIGYTFWFQHGGWDNYTSRNRVVTEPTVRFGSEQTFGGATWKAAIDSAATFTAGDTARLRFAIENTGLLISGQTFDLEFAAQGAAPSCEAVGSGSFVTVPNQSSCGSSPICMQASSNVTDGGAATDLLVGPQINFTQGKVIESPSYTTSAMTLNQNDYTELEYVVTPTTNAIDPNYCLRVTDAGTPVDTYLQVAKLNMRFDPTVTGVSLNGGSDISLVPGATTTVYVTGTATDLNGYTDMVLASSTVYRSGAGASCTADTNSCYISQGSPKCVFSSCAGNSCTISCRADLYYNADATDAAPYTGENWLAQIEITDVTGSLGIGSIPISPGIEVLSLNALDMTSAISYGSLAVSSTTGSFNPTTTVRNIGNQPIDVNVQGTDLSDGASSRIPAWEQRYSTSTFTYTACPTCSLLSSTSAAHLEVDLTKPTATSTPVTDVIYWGIAIPFGTASKAHSGTNIFYAVSD